MAFVLSWCLDFLFFLSHAGENRITEKQKVVQRMKLLFPENYKERGCFLVVFFFVIFLERHFQQVNLYGQITLDFEIMIFKE